MKFTLPRILTLAIVTVLALSGCAGGRSQRNFTPRVTQLTSETAAVTPTLTMEPTLVSATRAPTPTPMPTQTPFALPEITFNQDTNCRLGPSTAYYTSITYSKGETTKVDGRNEDSSWLWVKTPNEGDHCWIATSVVTNVPPISSAPVIPPAALPENPWGLNADVVCGSFNTVKLSWEDGYWENAYIIYRGDAWYAKVPANTVTFRDYPHNAKTYTYAVKAISQYGESQRIYITVKGCD